MIFIDAIRNAVPLSQPLEPHMGTEEPRVESVAAPLASVPSFTHEQETQLIRILLGALEIERHYHLFLWLRADIQAFLPHEALVSASGDFANWLITLDIVSSLPDVRTKQLADFNIDPFVQSAHAQWVAGERRALLLGLEDVGDTPAEHASTLYRALSGMRTILVHGVHDFRTGQDSIYILHSQESLDGDALERRLLLFELLVPQIDMAFRRVASLPLAVRRGSGQREDRFSLSVREQEILDLICRGETNSNIAGALAISPFTVKNHLQRIFKKIGVTNRTQAATKYHDALRELRKFLT